MYQCSSCPTRLAVIQSAAYVLGACIASETGKQWESVTAPATVILQNYIA